MDEEDQNRVGQRTGGKDRLDELSNKKCEADPLFPVSSASAPAGKNPLDDLFPND